MTNHDYRQGWRPGTDLKVKIPPRSADVKIVNTRCEELRIAVNKFHKEHPEVWDLFCKFAFEKIKQGHNYYGAKSVMERVRWETSAGGKSPKINNNYVAFYSRRFSENHPEYSEFFRTRSQISKLSPPKYKPDAPRGVGSSWR